MKNENKNEWSLLSSSLAIWNLYTSRNNYVGDCNMYNANASLAGVFWPLESHVGLA